jgi:Domain of unknown function (DUF4382)
MRRAHRTRAAITPSQTVFVTILFLSLGFIGCDNSCFVFISNPGGGIIAGGTSNCSLNQAKGNVHPRITSSLSSASGGQPARIQHIFVTLRGIEANPSATADEESSDWQELAPKLVNQPMQLDLLASRSDSHEPGTFEEVAVPADAYRQIRLRLSPNQPGASDSLQENSCRSVGLNCIVTSDGVIRPLVLDSGLSQIQVSSDHIADGFFRILPDTTVNLKIEFNPQSSLFITTGEVVRFVPAFTVDSQTTGESIASADQ